MFDQTQIKSHIQSEKQKLLAELIKFCEQPSLSSTGQGIAQMAQLVEEKLKALGAQTQNIVINGSHPYILADLKAKTNPESKKTVLIYDHYDVQPEDPLDEWLTPPFKPTIKDDKLFARGVSDNKANLVFRIQVVETYLKLFNDLPVNIKWLIEGEEEIGSKHMHDFQQQYGDFWKTSDVCIWETGSVNEHEAPRLILGMKGVLYVELACELNKKDLHSGLASIADSPVWCLVHALATLRASDGTVTVDGFYDHKQELSPELKHILATKTTDPATFCAELGIERPLKPTSSTPEFLTQMYTEGTANICGIWAGFTQPGGIKTVLPNKAYAKLDFRLVPQQKTSDILVNLKAHFVAHGFEDIKVTELVSEESGQTDLTNYYVQKCLEVFGRHYSQKPAIEPTTLGSGPIYYIASSYNIPRVDIGAEYIGCGAHSPNENIRLADYFKAMEVFSDYLVSI